MIANLHHHKVGPDSVSAPFAQTARYTAHQPDRSGHGLAAERRVIHLKRMLPKTAS